MQHNSVCSNNESFINNYEYLFTLDQKSDFRIVLN